MKIEPIWIFGLGAFMLAATAICILAPHDDSQPWDRTERQAAAYRRQGSSAQELAARMDCLSLQLRRLTAEHGRLQVWSECRMIEEAHSVIYNPKENRFELWP